MASLNALTSFYGAEPKIGKQLKTIADSVMEQTFYNDITTRRCYIYDYFSDDPETEDLEVFGTDYVPPEGSKKIPVDLKFMIKGYRSLAKDDPEYYVQFLPSEWNRVVEDPENQQIIPNYFQDRYGKFGVRYPVGLYIDAPDDRGRYQRWLVVYEDVANQFPKFGVLRCNYQLDWVIDKPEGRFKRKMWGVQRTQSSYNSGIYSFDKSTVMESQSRFWLPWNPISREIFYNQRIILSMPMDIPLCWQISKAQNTEPRGVLMLTLYQDTYNPVTDYIDKTDPDHWRMYADYYKFPATPEFSENEETENTPTGELRISSNTALVKIGGSYKTLTAMVYDENSEDITSNYSSFSWSFALGDGTDATDLVTTSEVPGSANKIKVKFLGDDSYVGQRLIATCTADDLTDEHSFDILFM